MSTTLTREPQTPAEVLELAEHIANEMLDVVTDQLGLPRFTFEWREPDPDISDGHLYIRGMCDFERCVIAVAPEVPIVDGPRGFHETMIHEIAHLIVGPAHDHCEHWAQVVVILGGTPEVEGYADAAPPILYQMAAYQLAADKAA